MGAALLNGAKSTAAAMIEAGYSPSTARNPEWNGITPAKAQREALEASLPPTTLRALDRKALKRADELLTSRETSDGVTAGLTLGVMKLRRELEPDSEDEQLHKKARLIAQARHTHTRIVIAGLRMACIALVRAGSEVPTSLDAMLGRLQKVCDARYVRLEQCKARERGESGMVKVGK